MRLSRVVGKTEPRLFTPPLRPLTRRTTRGYEVAEFAEAIGEPLLPWQRWLCVHALELNPDGSPRFRVVLVLVARQNGKSSVKRIVTLWRLYVDGARLVLGAAQDLKQAIYQWKLTLATIKATPDLAAELESVRRTNGQEEFALTGGGSYQITATNEDAGRGLSVDELNFDELRTQTDWRAWGALSKTTSARPNGQIWAMSNAGDDDSVVLNQLREAALSGRDPTIGIFEWSAPEGCELDDLAAAAQANPALGYTMHISAVHSARATDPPEVYRTEVLCQRVEQIDSAIDLVAWRASRDPAGTLDAARERIALCFDVAPDGAHSTLIAAAEVAGRVRVEVIGAWSDTDQARRALEELDDRIQPAARAWFPSGPAARLGPTLRKLGYEPITGATVAEACQGLADLVAGRRILHPDDPLLNAHIAGAVKLRQSDGWRFVRRGAGHVDAAYAAAGAVHTALTMPVEVPVPRPAVY